jgi:DNA-directed RNA polymerase subunit RPC12/RpoP
VNEHFLFGVLLGKCSICGKKGLLLRTNRCFSCGKEVCEKCLGAPFFGVQVSNDPGFHPQATLLVERNVSSCSESCNAAFKDFMMNRDFSKLMGTTLDSKRSSGCFDTFCDTFINEKNPKFKKEIMISSSFPMDHKTWLRVIGGSQAFNSIYTAFKHECFLALARNLEHAGRYQDAASVFENNLVDYESARKMREKDKRVEIRQTNVSVDLTAILKQFQNGGIVAVYRCPHCSGKLKISKDTTMKTLKTCEYCGSEIEAMELADFLKTALS